MIPNFKRGIRGFKHVQSTSPSTRKHDWLAKPKATQWGISCTRWEPETEAKLVFFTSLMIELYRIIIHIRKYLYIHIYIYYMYVLQFVMYNLVGWSSHGWYRRASGQVWKGKWGSSFRMLGLATLGNVQPPSENYKLGSSSFKFVLMTIKCTKYIKIYIMLYPP